MKRWLRHPSFRRLGEFADGECSEEKERQIRKHLAECARCRRELDFLIELRTASREIPSPRPPAGLKAEIMARWEAGERRILPLHDPPPAPERFGAAGLLGLAAGLLLVASAVVFLLVGEAAAGASQLRLSPEALPTESAMTVEYRTPSELAAEERLRLRVRYREADDPPPRERLGHALEAELDRVRPGRYRGALRLPDAAVYAVFSVEDLAGRRVDTDGGRFWEVMARDASGRPTFEALVERIRVLEHVHGVGALETAREATELHPDRVYGWFLRFLYEGLLLDGDRRDSLVAYHRERFAAFERRVAGRSEPSVGDLAALVHHARTLGDRDAILRWTARLEAAHPTHRVAVQERVLAAARRYGSEPESHLRALEEEWVRSGPMDEILLGAGFRAALSAGAPDPILAWGDRIERYVPHWAGRAAAELAAVPELRREGMARLRRELGRLEEVGPDIRPLDRAVREHRAESRERAARVLASLGRALAAEGETAAARDTLELAARWSWDPELFGELAELHLAVGDTAGALRLLAFAAADPLTPMAAVEGLRGTLGLAVEGAAWARLRTQGRAELRRRVLGRAENRPVPSDAKLVDTAGADRALADLLEPGPALLFYWSHRSFLSVRALPRLQEASNLLASAGVRIVMVTAEEPSPELEEFLRRRGVGLPIFFDAYGEVVDGLGLWGTPRYVVVDGARRVRFRQREVEEGLRHALVLAAIESAPAEPEGSAPYPE